MHFALLDRVLELSDDRIVTLKMVSAAEEYLQDHFPTYPVLPGVMMLEAMVQAARRLAVHRAGPPDLVLGRARAVKYGAFVRPGDSLRVEVSLPAPPQGGVWEFRGQALLLRAGTVPAQGDLPVAISGRLDLRPLRAAHVS